MIPVAVRVVRQVVQIRQVKAVRCQAEACRGGQLHADMRGGARGDQIAPFQLHPCELERGPQLDAEHAGRSRLMVRLGEPADRFVMLPGALAEQAERHQGVGLNPLGVRGLCGSRGLLGPGLRGMLVLHPQQGAGMGGQGTGTFPPGRILGQRVDRSGGSGNGSVVLIQLQQEVGEPLAGPAVKHRIGLRGQEAEQPPELLHSPRHVAAIRGTDR